jgi:hypothetical protein
MSYGLRNAAQTFQQWMNNTVLERLGALKELKVSENSSFLFWLIDDVLIATSDDDTTRRKLLFTMINKYKGCEE